METTLEMLKKVELATEGRTPSASKALAIKANVLFGISDNYGEHKEEKSAKCGRGEVLTEAHGGSGEAQL